MIEAQRCSWTTGHADLVRYHDDEWGFPVDDDVRLFEKMSLEGFQSGLSWLTILRKRENFRKAFSGFDWKKVARFDLLDDQVRFMVVNPATLRLVELLQEGLTGREALRRLADELNGVEFERVHEQGVATIERLRDAEIILGARLDA